MIVTLLLHHLVHVLHYKIVQYYLQSLWQKHQILSFEDATSVDIFVSKLMQLTFFLSAKQEIGLWQRKYVLDEFLRIAMIHTVSKII